MKILVVEDDEHIAKNLKKGLELKSHVVDVALDGEDGYDFAQSEDYDVIILDRMLPGMDGMEICKKLREDEIKTPILMLTAKTTVDDRVDGLNIGADDYLGKPFAFEELLARVNALARRPNETLQSVLKVDDLTLNPSTYEVKRGNTVLDLSKKEYSLLEFLIRNEGIVFTKEQLTERVWEFESDVLPNTAQVYIGYLRNKVDRAFPKKKELIQTVRGFGYKLE
ncbi:response regulator transcription factor [candidate division WWE3 bacterium]|uniref:Response regulator transcription factor n=1 Tax=candidate division WWE3 bacterium TaxID=2053526 RepID=A0A955RS15_UNCKA|nr:response regulator transcription factor [candidate division WWE3 bacterium]